MSGHTNFNVLKAKKLLKDSERIAILTGAGISTDSGIPDFRGPEGLWTKNPEAEKLSTIDNYIKDPEMRQASWDLFVTGWGNYEPNVGHTALGRLSKEKKTAVITQNIDGLHWVVDHQFTNTIDIHGNLTQIKCLECEMIWDKDDIETLVHKDYCEGLIKPNIIYFGEQLDRWLWTDAVGLVSSCDLFMAIGTSLQVWPAADLVDIAAKYGHKIIIVNGSSTEYDNHADIVLNGSISDILTELIK